MCGFMGMCPCVHLAVHDAAVAPVQLKVGVVGSDVECGILGGPALPFLSRRLLGQQKLKQMTAECRHLSPRG